MNTSSSVAASGSNAAPIVTASGNSNNNNNNNNNQNSGNNMAAGTQGNMQGHHQHHQHHPQQHPGSVPMNVGGSAGAVQGHHHPHPHHHPGQMQPPGQAQFGGMGNNYSMMGNNQSGGAVPLSRSQLEALSTSESLLELHTKVIPGRLSRIWVEQKEEVESIVPSQKYNFKHHNDLPLARIKRIMKSDESVRMISAEAPILLAKATELFLLDLTIRANCYRKEYSEHFRRGSIEKEDVIEVIRNTPTLDFLAAIMEIPQGPGVHHFITGQAKMQ